MVYGLSNGHVTDDVKSAGGSKDAAILATAWLLVLWQADGQTGSVA